MESFIIGLNIALFFGALAGLVGLFALPFLADMVVKNRNKIGQLEELNAFRLEEIKNLTRKLDIVEARLETHLGKLNHLFKQIDGIESDLEKAKLSSIAPVKGVKGPVKLNKKPVLDKIKGSSVDSAVKNNVYHLSNSKQGGKRANKSRNR